MIFKRILINNFGGLREKDIELTSGVNVLYGLKETEMNIVFIFVKSMFFGVPEEMQEKNGIYEKAGTEASREKYGGTIWFQHNGKDYRLMREIGAGIHNCELFCEDTREILNGENGALERILGGFSENLFDNTVMIESLSGSSSREMAKELQNKLAVLSKSGDGLVDLGRTEQMLKMWRKGYLTQKERGRKAVQREQEKLSEKLESLQNDLDGLRDQAEVYIRDAYILGDMRKDYNLFNSQLGILGTEKETFTKYLQKEKTISDIAEDQGITYESARQQMQKIKVRMKKQVKRFMDGQPGGIA